MSHVTLVRHGQANSPARDEDSYDKLSDLGWQQARWLGDYFRQAGDVFPRVYCGTLRRQIETAQGIGQDVKPQQDARLNELAYFDLATLLEAQHGIAIPSDREGFVTHLPTLFRYWQEDRIQDAPETFATFETRVSAVVREIAEQPGRALVVTSGGLIGMTMRIVMRLDIAAMAHACLAVENSSVHRLQPMATGLAITQFNALPHLDTPTRQHARSHL